MHTCQDPDCKCYGERFVDRGWGYPVCPSTPKRLISLPFPYRWNERTGNYEPVGGED